MPCTVEMSRLDIQLQTDGMPSPALFVTLAQRGLDSPSHSTTSAYPYLIPLSALTFPTPAAGHPGPQLSNSAGAAG